MRLDLARAALRTESLVLVLPEQLFDDAFADCRRRGMIGVGDFVAKDVGKGCVAVRAFEGSRGV